MAALVALAIPAAGSAASAYTPTMQDVMSVNAALHRYLVGIDARDPKSFSSAFTADGTLQIVSQGRVGRSLRGPAEIETFIRPSTPAAQGAPAGEGAAEIVRRHYITNEYVEFQSPTRANHFAYWVNVMPGEGQTSEIGASGRYEDVMVKQNGEWYILERKVFVGK